MKHLSQNEAIGICAALLVIGFIFFGNSLQFLGAGTQEKKEPVRVAAKVENGATAAEALANATDPVTGELTELVIEDIIEGTGEPVANGDVVTVHYLGLLKDGTKFDDSTVRGTPYTFTVGAGEVIKGWDQGVVGMKKGGERVIVIPPDLAYGNRKLGPIPANSTILFSIKLIDVK